MKKREDMIKNVHRRIDEYKAEQKKKRIRLTFTAAPVCAAAVVGVGLWTSGAFNNSPEKSVVETLVPEETIQVNVVQTTALTEKYEKHTADFSTTAAKPVEKLPAGSTAVEVKPTETHTNAVAETKTEEEPQTAETVPALPETTEVPTAATESDTNSGGGSSAVIDRLGDAYINGEYYLQCFGGTYTPDQFIGYGSDFDGFYKDCGVDSEFYTAKESSDIIIVRLANGGEVSLKKYMD